MKYELGSRGASYLERDAESKRCSRRWRGAYPSAWRGCQEYGNDVATVTSGGGERPNPQLSSRSIDGALQRRQMRKTRVNCSSIASEFRSSWWIYIGEDILDAAAREISTQGRRRRSLARTNSLEPQNQTNHVRLTSSVWIGAGWRDEFRFQRVFRTGSADRSIGWTRLLVGSDFWVRRARPLADEQRGRWEAVECESAGWLSLGLAARSAWPVMQCNLLVLLGTCQNCANSILADLANLKRSWQFK